MRLAGVPEAPQAAKPSKDKTSRLHAGMPSQRYHAQQKRLERGRMGA
jgi:hypothetical protein